MNLYIKECRRIASGIVYYLFIAVIIFSWFRNFKGVTKTEIDCANSKEISDMGFGRPLLREPTQEDKYFGSKTSEDDPVMIMTGVTRALLMEYKNNSYATYPLGYYKAVTLSESQQCRVLDILCEITGLTEQQLLNLPKDYFPAVTGTIFSTDSMTFDENGQAIYKANTDEQKDTDKNSITDKTKKFESQVDYEHFQDLMTGMENIIGEKGSKYSKEMMITYFGITQMTYEEACADYQLTIHKDKVTGGFARLFCDYMGLSLGLYPIFIVVVIWMKDITENTAELIYSKKISSFKLIFTRYAACITMNLIPVFLLSLESLIPLVLFGIKNNFSVDCLAFIKYIMWWLLPVVMLVSAVGMFITLMTNSPIAVIVQIIWWFVDKGITGLSGDTGFFTLMIRHNSLEGYQIIQNDSALIWINRSVIIGISLLIVGISVLVLDQKRKGKINASVIYKKCVEHIKNKLSFINTQ